MTTQFYLSQIEEDDIVKSGYLMKQSDWLNMSRSRWCILTRSKIIYAFKTNENPQQKPTKIFDLSQQCTINVEGEDKFQLCLQSESTRFNAATGESRDEWVKQIKTVLDTLQVISNDGKQIDIDNIDMDVSISLTDEKIQEKVKRDISPDITILFDVSYEALTDECDKYQKQIRQHKAKNNTLLDDKEKMLSECKRLTNTLKAERQRNKILFLLNGALKQNINGLHSDKYELEQNMNKMQEKLLIAMGMEQQLSSAVQNLSAKINIGYENYKHESQEEYVRLSQKMDLMQIECDMSLSQMDQLKKQQQNMDMREQDHTVQIIELTEKLTRNADELKAKDERINELQTNNMTYSYPSSQISLVQKQGNNHELYAEIGDLKKNIEFFKEKVESYAMQIKNAGDSAMKQKERMGILEEDNKKLKNELNLSRRRKQKLIKIVISVISLMAIVLWYSRGKRKWFLNFFKWMGFIWRKLFNLVWGS